MSRLSMETIPIEKAVGMVLGHDITRIVPGVFKGPAFKKGHIIKEEDIPEFLKIGKENIYVLDLKGRIHENDAAYKIAYAAVGKNIRLGSPVEGKISLTADIDGLLKVNFEALNRINDVNDVIFSTIHTNQTVKKGQIIAGTRIIPLCTEENNIRQVETICKKSFPVMEVKHFIPRKIGIITTGSEVYYGRIEDKFTETIISKFRELGSEKFEHILVPDDVDMTVNAISEMIEQGVEMLAITGGMSVDPDDKTPLSISAAGGNIISYGAPVLPGAMFMLAYIKNIPVIGLPACVMFYRTTVFDLIVPRLIAGDIITKHDIVSMGHGGFCSSCQDCRYPLCGFGK